MNPSRASVTSYLPYAKGVYFSVEAGVKFKTYSGLPFTYEIRKGRDGRYGLIDVPDSVKEYMKGKNPTVALPGMGNTPLWDFFCPGELLRLGEHFGCLFYAALFLIKRNSKGNHLFISGFFYCVGILLFCNLPQSIIAG